MDINKLPKWVQGKIYVLERDLEFYKKQIREISGEEETDIKYSIGFNMDHPLPKDSKIVFTMDCKKEISCYIKNKKRNKLVIRANHGEIVIHPSAANSIEVEIIE